MSRFQIRTLVDFAAYDGSADEVLAEWGFDTAEDEITFKNTSGIEEMPTEFWSVADVTLRSDSLNHLANFLEADFDNISHDVLNILRYAEIVD